MGVEELMGFGVMPCAGSTFSGLTPTRVQVPGACTSPSVSVTFIRGIDAEPPEIPNKERAARTRGGLSLRAGLRAASEASDSLCRNPSRATASFALAAPCVVE